MSEAHRWPSPQPRIYLKGSKIFCVNGHCCAFIKRDISENEHIDDILSALKMLGSHQTINGYPEPICKECGGEIMFGCPRTIH